MKKVSNTVFNVSLPITKGSVLLERTSFSVDSLPVSSARSPSFDSDPVPTPESQSEDCELDCDTGPFAVNHAEHTSVCTTSQLQQELSSGDANAGQYMRAARNYTQYQELDGYFSDNQYINQFEDITGTKDQLFYGGNNYNRQRGSQVGSSKRFYKEWQNEGPQTQNEGLSSAVSHTQDWSSYSSYGRDGGCTEQWYNSTQFNREEREREMSSYATQQYDQQRPQTSLLTGSVGQRGLSVGLAHLDAARINMPHHS